jgi:peptidase M42 family hydrolase
MKPFPIDESYLRRVLTELLHIPSPTGRTDAVVGYLQGELRDLEMSHHLNRRGTVLVSLPGSEQSRAKAVAAHADTLGAMVKGLKDNGRLEVTMLGHWSPRFAEGARVTVFADDRRVRGSILPLKLSAHTFGKAIDKQPVDWDNLEIRLDARVSNRKDLENLGVHVGDYVALDPLPEWSEGFLSSRYLDDKAGVACILTALKVLRDQDLIPPQSIQALFTITEEEGSGGSTGVAKEVEELLCVDNGTLAPGQNTCEFGATVVVKDSGGPYNYHLTRRLLELCTQDKIPHSREVFRFYRSDAAAIVSSGSDVRTALVAYGCDGSHAWERVHEDSLFAVTRLVVRFLMDPLSSPYE